MRSSQTSVLCMDQMIRSRDLVVLLTTTPTTTVAPHLPGPIITTTTTITTTSVSADPTIGEMAAVTKAKRTPIRLRLRHCLRLRPTQTRRPTTVTTMVTTARMTQKIADFAPSVINVVTLPLFVKRIVRRTLITKAKARKKVIFLHLLFLNRNFCLPLIKPYLLMLLSPFRQVMS